MARTKVKSFKERLEKDVLEKLTVKPYSIKAMADQLGQNYYSVRRVYKELEEQGLLYIVRYEHGAAVYKLTEPTADRLNNSIPTVKGRTGAPVKLTDLLNLVGKEDNSTAAQAAKDLPRNMVRIFMAALRYVDTDGKYNIDKNLKNIRLEMETNVLAMENVLNLYRAILQEDVFWNDFKVKAIPFDAEFDRDKVIEAYRYYYPED